MRASRLLRAYERMVLIDERFERGFEEMSAMREEMRAGFAALRADLAGTAAAVTGAV